MRRLALTTWSLHRKLGSPPMIALPDEDSGPVSQAELQLTDVPRRMQEQGIGTLEICHFHFPSASPDYLRTLRTAIETAEVELFSILIDTGDISHPDSRRREADIKLIERWMEIAAALGAQAARVVAGEGSPNDEAALGRAIAGLEHLAGHGRELGLRVLTENFRPLASTAANCNRILDALDGAVGLCADVGNFPDASRVSEFKAVVDRASSVHAKPSYDAGGRMDPRQLRECLAASVDAGFDGPYTLVYDRPGDAWQGIAELKEVVSAYLQ
jgi:sugar phosphate isomerase/epimerase